MYLPLTQPLARKSRMKQLVRKTREVQFERTLMSPRNFYDPFYELEKSAGKVDVFFIPNATNEEDDSREPLLYLSFVRFRVFVDVRSSTQIT